MHISRATAVQEFSEPPWHFMQVYIYSTNQHHHFLCYCQCLNTTCEGWFRRWFPTAFDGLPFWTTDLSAHEVTRTCSLQANMSHLRRMFPVIKSLLYCYARRSLLTSACTHVFMQACTYPGPPYLLPSAGQNDSPSGCCGRANQLNFWHRSRHQHHKKWFPRKGVWVDRPQYIISHAEILMQILRTTVHDSASCCWREHQNSSFTSLISKPWAFSMLVHKLVLLLYNLLERSPTQSRSAQLIQDVFMTAIFCQGHGQTCRVWFTTSATCVSKLMGRTLILNATD